MYYAVKVGKKRGIYSTWGECQANVQGYSGAIFRKFGTEAEALAFISDNYQSQPTEFNQTQSQPLYFPQGSQVTINPQCPSVSPDALKYITSSMGTLKSMLSPDEAVVYIDSYLDNKTGVYGFGAYMLTSTSTYTYSGADNSLIIASTGIAGGTIWATVVSIAEALKLSLRKLTIVHKYDGITNWATGLWGAKKPVTRAYVAFIADYSTRIDIDFKNLSGTKGVFGIDKANALAKASISRYYMGNSLDRSNTHISENSFMEYKGYLSEQSNDIILNKHLSAYNTDTHDIPAIMGTLEPRLSDTPFDIDNLLQAYN